MSTHDEIAGLARELAAAQKRLADTVRPLREEQRSLMRRRSRGIRNRVAEVAAAREALHAAVDENRHLFEKPRTRAHEGVKYGLRKGAGKLVGDQDAVIGRVRATMPDRAEELLETKTALIKAALKRLTGKELAALGVSITDAEDKVTIKVATDDDLERFVSLLMADLEESVA